MPAARKDPVAGPGARGADERPVSPPSIADIVDALMLLDEPMLNSRFHGLLLRLTDDDARGRLARLPGLVTRSLQLSRQGAYEWMRTGVIPHDSRLPGRAERVLLEAFLAMSEQQIRLITFLARSAPTNEIRRSFDEMAEMHRSVSQTLRSVLRDHEAAAPDAQEREPGVRERYRGVQEEAAAGDLRGQLEAAIESAKARGRPVRTIVLSHTGLRNLRDQGCFANGETAHMGIPVAVDLAWDVAAFTLLSFDVVPLDEIVASVSGPRAGVREGPA